MNEPNGPTALAKISGASTVLGDVGQIIETVYENHYLNLYLRGTVIFN